jgi:hypothetical protein
VKLFGKLFVTVMYLISSESIHSAMAVATTDNTCPQHTAQCNGRRDDSTKVARGKRGIQSSALEDPTSPLSGAQYIHICQALWRILCHCNVLDKLGMSTDNLSTVVYQSLACVCREYMRPKQSFSKCSHCPFSAVDGWGLHNGLGT